MPNPAANPERATAWLTAATAAGFAFVTVASFLPGERLWGINHLAFYPVWVRLVALALIAATFLPPVARALYARLLAIPRGLSGGAGAVLTLVLVAVFSVALFWSFRSATNLLGDGHLIATGFEAAEAGNTDVIVRSVGAIVREERIAPGATLLHYLGANVAADGLGRSPVAGMQMLNCILGGLFVLLVLALVRRLDAPDWVRAWLLWLALLGAWLQLFFGYIENYTPLMLLLALYAMNALMVLHGRGSVWLGLLAIGAAVYVHVQAVLFIPSAAMLVAWRLAGPRRDKLLAISTPVISILIVALTAFAWWFTNISQFMLPPRDSGEFYGIASPTHFLDILNQVLMLLPVLPTVLVALWLGRGAGPDAGDGTPWFATRAEWRIVWLMLLPCLVYLVWFRPEIGMARDWDLFAMTGVALVPLALLSIRRAVGAADLDASHLARVTMPAFALTAILTVAWIGVNASPERSPERLLRILDYDRTHAGYAYENLAVFHYDRGDVNRAIRTMETAIAASPNPRYSVRLATYYEETGNVEASIQLLNDTLERHPDFEKARRKLVDTLDKARRPGNLMAAAREGIERHPEQPIYYFYYGEMLIRQGRVEEGLDVFRTCLALDPPEGARRHIERRFREFADDE